MNKYVHYKIKDNIATVTIDKPPVNAMDKNIVKELSVTFEMLTENTSVGAVILTGAGRAFVAGAEIKDFLHMNRNSGEAFALSVTDMLRKIEEFPGPVIAAINGFALGGGCELALACDIRIASDKAKLGLPEVTLGLIPGAGGTQRLPRLIPVGTAKRLIYTGEMIESRDAERIGLVDLVTDHGKEALAARELASKIIKNGPLAVRFAKKAINRGMQMSLSDAVMVEATLFGELFQTKDAKEGITAFIEKRLPEFQSK